jgi:hypothetical protein
MTFIVLGICNYPLLPADFVPGTTVFDPTLHISSRTIELKNPDQVKLLATIPDGKHIIALPLGTQTPIIMALRDLKPL